MAEWTAKELTAAQKLWRDGVTIDGIATALGRTRNSVDHQIKRSRDRFPRRQQPWGTMKDCVSFRCEISPLIMKEIKKEAKERGTSINVLIREALRDRFVRKSWKPQQSTSIAKVPYSNGSRGL